MKIDGNIVAGGEIELLTAHVKIVLYCVHAPRALTLPFSESRTKECCNIDFILSGRKKESIGRMLVAYLIEENSVICCT